MNRALIRDMGYKKVFIKEVSSIIYDSSRVEVSKGEMGVRRILARFYEEELFY